MIEINLLPEEYRRPDGTPIPMVLTIVIGVIVVGSLGAASLKLLSARQNFRSIRDDKIQLRDSWRVKAQEIDKIVKDINKYKKRQQTIINISFSKIMWSQKLFQLTQIFSKYKDFWVQTISMSQSGLSGRLTLNCFALGEYASTVTRFRTYLRRDYAFFYHFKTATSPIITVIPGSEDDPVKMSFSMTLELRDNPVRKKKR
jgi:hypothetical protein